MAIDPISALLNLILSLWCSFFGCGSPNSDSNTAQSTDVIVVISSPQAYAQEIRVHSSTLFKVSLAIQAENPDLSEKVIAQAVTKVCAQSKVEGITINKQKFLYGWNAAPKNIRCTVEARGDWDFKVTVRGETGITSINGETPK
jgi:hypothetical protein